MRFRFRLVDVFTDRPLAGNQLCVIPEPPSSISDQVMQAVAREIGFSETTFVGQAGGDRYSVRIFTPGTEIPFAGHPTLGTAYVLVEEGRVRSPVTQVLVAGEVPVSVNLDDGLARMEQFPPEFGDVVKDSSAIAEAVSLDQVDLAEEMPAQFVSTGFPFLLVPLRTREAVTRARPFVPALSRILEGSGSDAVYAFHLDGGLARARMFSPQLGLLEDAATGSAAGPLGAYLASHGRVAGRLTVFQGVEMGRPSTLLVDVEPAGDGWRVFVGGSVVPVGEGWFDLPD
jgi:trans-2,3-dihydro-3-hydroxyanthranilate isomerase